MPSPTARLLRCALFCCLAVTGAGAMAATETLSLQSHGKLSFQVPDNWNMKHLEGQPNQPPVLEFAPNNGDLIRVHVVVLWTRDPDTQYNRPEAIHKLMQMTCDSQLFTATEQQCDLKDLHAGASSGFWYALTDRAPVDGDFRYMLRGNFPVGPLLLDFTALSRSTLRDGDKTVLGIVGSAQLQPDQQP